VGNSSRDIALTAQLKLAEYTESVSNVLKPNVELKLLKQ
jgi:beta-glucosidase